MKFFKILIISTIFIGNYVSAGTNIIVNGDFSQGMKGWWSYPKAAKNIKIVNSPGERGQYLLIAPESTNMGVNSYNLPLGDQLKRTKSYNLSFDLKVKNIKQGVAAVSLLFFTKNKKILKQFFLHKIGQGTRADWQTYSFKIGARSRFTIPADAAYAQLRISFWERSGKCQGAIMVDNIKIIAAIKQRNNKIQQITATDVGVIKSRHEQLQDKNFYWIEAEDMVPKAAYIGSFKYRNTWNYRKTGLPNDSMEHSLVRPLSKAVTTTTATITCRPGNYNLWLRIGTFRPWQSETVTLHVNGKLYKVAAKAADSSLSKAFSWVKIADIPFELKDQLKLTVTNAPNPERMKVLDCFLLTSDLQYTPQKQLPSWHYFTALPYKGPILEADFWHPRQLNCPVYICQNSAQQFLFRLRNYSNKPLKDFDIQLLLPTGITLVDPTRQLRWQGDGKKWHDPHFIADSPSAIEHRTVTIYNKQYNQYNLIYNNPIKPYNVESKVNTLTFITLQADKTIKPGSYTVEIKPFNSAGKWTGAIVKQQLEILPALKGVQSARYNWGVDGIYAAFLSSKEQKLLLKTFNQAGINLWASRVRAASLALAKRNQALWQYVRKLPNMKVVNWSEWFWPGTPYTDKSLKYCQAHPEALGVWRNDDRGKSLKDKLICPSYLLSAESSYLEEHLKPICQLLKANGITEYLEDVEYSSPLSYCFCASCKHDFAKYCKLDYNTVKELSGDQLIKQYRKQWVDFRTQQNTQLIAKLSTIANKLYPQIKFKLFCGYQSWGVKNRYGVDWEQLLKLPHVAGAYIGGGMPGTAEQINQTMQWSKKNHKEFLSMGNATLSFPHGYDEMGSRNQAYLEARIIHDIMCGSGGLFIWWWGTLDGRCLKAFETGSKLGAEYGDIMLDGVHKYRQVGLTKDFSLLTSSNKRGTLICLANPSRHTEDRVLEPEAIMKLFPKKQQILNVLTGKYETYSQISQRIAAIYRKGEVSLWFIPTVNQAKKALAAWPKEIIADIGDLQVRFESRSFWTLYRIDYQGSRLGLDQFGSHYGYVVKYPKIGFIGSGHTENAKEQVKKLALYVNGQAVLKPNDHYKCHSIKLVKQAQIGNLLFNSKISVSNGQIIEDIKITANKPEQVDCIYLFMQPWTTSFSDYAVLDKGHEMQGSFTDSKKYLVNKPVRVVTLFNQKLNKGIITCITPITDDLTWKNLYWDVPKRYRKHYLKAFINTTIKPGKNYHFRAVTMPFSCTRKNWLKRARQLQKTLINI